MSDKNVAIALLVGATVLGLITGIICCWIVAVRSRALRVSLALLFTKSLIGCPDGTRIIYGKNGGRIIREAIVSFDQSGTKWVECDGEQWAVISTREGLSVTDIEAVAAHLTDGYRDYEFMPPQVGEYT